jgi:cysteinyl-tRNA synthetase
MSGAPPEVVALAEKRAASREAKDFIAADALRDRIAELGWVVVDQPGGGWSLELASLTKQVGGRVRSKDVGSLLDEPATCDISLHWVAEGWPEDIERAIASFRRNAGGRSVQYVVADVTGEDSARWGEDVEVVSLVGDTGWAAARNAGLKRTLGRTVFILDGSIEAAGDVFGPLEEALTDETVGVCGPFGIVTADLRQFDEAPAPGDVDAIEAYLMAARRETLNVAGLFDEKFKWYRTADIEWSFRVKDQGLRALVVPVPATKHEHRMWFETDPAERAKWSKRNYYRFLDKFRGRYDLCVNPKPP